MRNRDSKEHEVPIIILKVLLELIDVVCRHCVPLDVHHIDGTRLWLQWYVRCLDYRAGYYDFFRFTEKTAPRRQ